MTLPHTHTNQRLADKKAASFKSWSRVCSQKAIYSGLKVNIEMRDVRCGPERQGVQTEKEKMF